MRPSACPTKRRSRTHAPCIARRANTEADGRFDMPTVRSNGLLRDIAATPCIGGAFPQRDRYRRDALDLIEREDLIDAAYCYRIVPLDEAPNACLRAGGGALGAMRLGAGGGGRAGG